MSTYVLSFIVLIADTLVVFSIFRYINTYLSVVPTTETLFYL